MKSVGEAMAIGRTFKEALQKSVRSLEVGRDGLGPLERDAEGNIKGWEPSMTVHDLLRIPNRDRIFAVYEALAGGDSEATVCQITGFDPWFVAQMGEIVGFAKVAARAGCRTRCAAPSAWVLATASWPAYIPRTARPHRLCRKRTCGRCARSAASSLPITWWIPAPPSLSRTHPICTAAMSRASEAPPSDRRKIMILGGGPNRIGQGIEFDYCCCHASFALAGAGLRDDHGQLQPGDGEHRL